MSKAREARIDVLEVTSPDNTALRFVLASNLWKWACSFFVGTRFLPSTLRDFFDAPVFEFSHASNSRVFFSVVSERYVAANTERAPAAAPPRPVVKICKVEREAEAATAIIPSTENIPSMDPKTSSAARLLES